MHPRRLEVVADTSEAWTDMGKLLWRSRQGGAATERREGAITGGCPCANEPSQHLFCLRRQDV